MTHLIKQTPQIIGALRGNSMFFFHQYANSCVGGEATYLPAKKDDTASDFGGRGI